MERADFGNPREVSRAIEALAPLVDALADPIARAHWMQRLARIGRVDVATVQRLIRSSTTGQPAGPSLEAAASPAGEQSVRDPAAEAERQVLGLLLRHEQLADFGQTIEPAVFESEDLRGQFIAWCAGERGAAAPALSEPASYDTLPEAELQRLVRDLVQGLRAQRRQLRLRAETRAIARATAEARQARAYGEQALLAERLAELTRQSREVTRG